MANLNCIGELIEADNWLGWITVRHFLPAPFLRELVLLMLSAVDENLEKHYIDELIGSTPVDQSWLLMPVTDKGDKDNYWTDVIRIMAAQLDVGKNSILPNSDGANFPAKVLVRFALDFGALELESNISIPDNLISDGSPVLNNLINVWSNVKTAFENRDFEKYEFICKSLKSDSSLLILIFYKHLGDILLGGGDVPGAIIFYRTVLTLLESKNSEKKSIICVLSLWRNVCGQSLANALNRLGENEDFSLGFMNNFYTARSELEPFFAINSSLDAFIFNSRSDGVLSDARCITCLAPLLRTSHDNEYALALRIKGEYAAADDEFWAIQRRQIALGLSYDSSRTSGLWAQSTLEWMSKDISSWDVTDFLKTVRLFMMSNDASFVSNFLWSERLVEHFVNEEVVEFVKEYFERSNLTIIQAKILTELICAWLRFLNSNNFLIDSLLDVLVYVASKDWRGSNFEEMRLISLKSIDEIFKIGIDVRLRESNLAVLLSDVIEHGKFHEVLSALSICNNVGSRIKTDDLSFLLGAILNLLSRENALRMGWPIIRPAMDFISSSIVAKMLLDKNMENQRRLVLDILLRVGMAAETEHASMLAKLRYFEDDLPQDINEKLILIVAGIVASIENPNSSNSIFHIHSLLNVPNIVGEEAIFCAIESLKKIIEGGEGSQTKIGFPKGYEVLSHLRIESQRICEKLSINKVDFLRKLEPLLKSLESMWRRSIEYPYIFSEMSFIKRNAVSEAVVHNWALETLAFSEFFGRSDEFKCILNSVVSEQKLLSQGIKLSFTTMSGFDNSFSEDLKEISIEARDEFYSKLGRRLAFLLKYENEELWKILVERCLVLGPRPDDAAVFMLGKQGWKSNRYNNLIHDYSQRIASNRNLRLLLIPLIDQM